MLNQGIKQLLLNNGFHPGEFDIPVNVRSEGCEKELRSINSKYRRGCSSMVIVYDRVSLQEALSTLEENMRGMFACVNFSYEQTIGKEFVLGYPKGYQTNGLGDHLFMAQETEYETRTLIFYHSFREPMDEIAALLNKTEDNSSNNRVGDIIAFLDGGCGRGWSHAHAHMNDSRLPKMIASPPLIATALVMPLDVKAAINYYTRNYNSCSRSDIGRDCDVHYIF